jgi:hypothetical protein
MGGPFASVALDLHGRGQIHPVETTLGFTGEADGGDEDRQQEWVQTHKTALWWVAAGSAVAFAVTLAVVPWLVVRIPSDYFAHGKRHRTPWADHHPVVRVALLAGKNLVGCVFIVAGILMLVLPGQGMLTILVGMVLLDFPSKFAIERWVVSRRPVLRSVNWLRQRAKREPLVLDR